MKKSYAPFLLCLLAIPQFAHADNFNFNIDNFQQQNIGNTGVSGGFDMLTLSANSGNVALTPGVSTVAFLSNLTWVVGFTGSNSTGLHSGYNAVRNLTLDGITQAFNQAFADLVGTDVDDLELGSSATETFNLGAAGQVDVTLLGTFIGTDTSITSGVNAEFLLHDVPAAVPEPGALLLLLTVVGLVGLAAKGKRLDRGFRHRA